MRVVLTFLMWRSMFSMTTIASSTTSPVASVMPNSVRVLIEKPSSLTKANVPISDTGMVIAGIIVVRQSCRKMKITRMTSTIASSKRAQHISIDSPTASVVSNANWYFMPGGKRFGQPLQFGDRLAVHFERIGIRELRNSDAHSVVPVELQIGAVIFRAQFGASDVADPHQRAVGIGLQNDVFKLRRFAQPPDRAHADLIILPGGWRLSDLSGGDLHVLFLQARKRHRTRSTRGWPFVPDRATAAWNICVRRK